MQQPVKPTHQCLLKQEATMSNDYTVGYGVPPIATRFKPGQSGNPSGRPKGRMDTLRVLDLYLNKKVPASVNNKRINLSRKQAILLNLINKSAAGDTKATKTLLPIMLQIDERNERNNNLSHAAKSLTDRAILDEFIKAAKDG